MQKHGLPRRIYLLFFFSALLASPLHAQSEFDALAFKPLFNGKNLDGLCCNGQNAGIELFGINNVPVPFIFC